MDDGDLEYLSLEGETKSLFDDLGFVFGWTKGDVVLGHEGRSVLSLYASTKSGSGFVLAARPKHGQTTLVGTGLRSVPQRAGEKRQEGYKRKGSKGPQLAPMVLKKNTH
ncbi:hypothetical protein AMTR_s00124p00048760 [Amborella trichopoda]|uniref:Uncharacterized protein n=1 Tax=Amborella trichopoda TaxID=13333 RepID=W1NR32_AMBTC|nr:hypothetical protein AMTR_s00124p00048760 [Amborella trichopoda]